MLLNEAYNITTAYPMVAPDNVTYDKLDMFPRLLNRLTSDTHRKDYEYHVDFKYEARMAAAKAGDLVSEKARFAR